MNFEWDAGKAAANVKKHRLTFEEASTVFSDPLAMTIPDAIHAAEEQREITVGSTIKGNLVFVSHCERAQRIRIISARRATRAERIQYEAEFRDQE